MVCIFVFYLQKPLLVASKNGHTNVVIALAEAGADVNQCEERDGNTLLHLASQSGNAEVVSTLMACNASLTAKNKQGQLPIDVTANDQIRQLINDEMTARFDHGLKRAVMPAVDSEAAVEVVMDIYLEGGDNVGGSAGAVSIADNEDVCEDSSDEEDDDL